MFTPKDPYKTDPHTAAAEKRFDIADVTDATCRRVPAGRNEGTARSQRIRLIVPRWTLDENLSPTCNVAAMIGVDTIEVNPLTIVFSESFCFQV